ncbi:MAG: hypothetical protein WCP20_13030 [Desulfuromonadales bacterium]
MLDELGIKVLYGASWHYDQHYDHGAQPAITTELAAHDRDIPFGIGEQQNFEIANLLRGLKPDLYFSRHPGSSVWAAKQGIVTVPVMDEYAAAIERAIPIIHAGPGCGQKLWSALSSGNGFQGYGYAGGHSVPCSNSAENEIVFGGEEKLRETIDDYRSAARRAAGGSSGLGQRLVGASLPGSVLGRHSGDHRQAARADRPYPQPDLWSGAGNSIGTTHSGGAIQSAPDPGYDGGHPRQEERLVEARLIGLPLEMRGSNSIWLEQLLNGPWNWENFIVIEPDGEMREELFSAPGGPVPSFL